MLAILKQVHLLLSRLSPDECSHRDTCGDATAMDVQNQWLATRIKYNEISELSNFLFDKLRWQFDLVLSSSGLVPSSEGVKGDVHITSEEVAVDELILLLRCCMTMLRFLEFDLSVVMEKCQTIIAILRKLCFLGPPLHPNFLNMVNGQRIDEFSKSSLGQCTNAHGGTNVGARKPISFLCSILEVFLDEISVSHQLRKHIMIRDYLSDTEKLFVSHGRYGDINIILEIISCHFLLSVYDEWAIGRYIHLLPWSNNVIPEAPVLSLTAALTLLGTPVILTAPPMFQAHLILLISRCVGIQKTKGWKSDAEILDRYIAAFEVSVNLYANYISSIEFGNFHTGHLGHSHFSVKEPSFESCIRSDTCDKLKLQISKLLNVVHKQSLSGTKAGFLKHSATYIMQNRQVIDELFRDEACSILNCTVSAILQDEVLANSFQNSGKRIQEENYCFAAVLRLMSSLLLQISWILRQNQSQGRSKNVRDHIVCKDYCHISGLICSLGKLGAYENVKSIFLNRMETNHGRHKGTQLMWVHFASLLSYSFSRKIEFLWMNGVFMMMAWINFLIIKEGNLDAFRPLLSYIGVTSITPCSLAQISQELDNKKSSALIASQIQSIRALYVKDQVKCLMDEDQEYLANLDANDSKKLRRKDGVSDISTRNLAIWDPEQRDLSTTEADSRSGEMFIKCLPEFHRNPFEWDDLVDFIDCRHGKDYSTWLNKRVRFRKWRHEKIEIARHQKIKKFRGAKFSSSVVRRSARIKLPKKA